MSIKSICFIATAYQQSLWLLLSHSSSFPYRVTCLLVKQSPPSIHPLLNHYLVGWSMWSLFLTHSLLIGHVRGDANMATSPSVSCSKGKRSEHCMATTPFVPTCCHFFCVTQTPPQTNMCRWIHKPERQRRIYPTCIQPFHCVTMKQVSLV